MTPTFATTAITMISGYSTASVDNFLINWALTVTGTTAKTINLAGVGAGIANQPRSAASDAAVLDLTNNHAKTIITN